ncbi:unnamed protein product [Arabidopsis thaliana]|uniref:DUF4218 domain-containing protein n=1 Tax=Arabidopsis thaliana TaxID=3702 RepID=A0A654EFU5_ARATH|nr:unnamed protein product [Arabidopsis thaliana]
MEHIPIHLPRELAFDGPVQYQWMYPFVRYMFPTDLRWKFPSEMSYLEFRESTSNRSRRSPIGSATPSPSPSNVPETGNTSPQAVMMTIEDFVRQPGRQHLPRLHPEEENGATWFGLDSGITKSILRIFKTQLDQPWPTYENVDPETKFISSSLLRVRLHFDIQVNLSYQNHMYSWKQKWRKGKDKPRDLDPDVWNGYIRYWSMEDTEATSTQNSKNRKSGRGGKGVATVSARSITF